MMSRKLRPDTIFDIGMHEGQDTAYYLHRGYKVVAVDANPTLCDAGAKRFEAAISAGRLEIVNAAVGAERGVLPFYVSSKDIWSSFDPAVAGKLGSSCREIQVESLCAADLFAKYGVPYYLKIDIEGADSYCLGDLEPSCLPVYISFEAGATASEDVTRLERLGYRRFKLINQVSKEFRSEWEPEPALQRLRLRLRRKFRNVIRGRWRNDWIFEMNSSGPFGEDTDGSWVSAVRLREILARWKNLDDHNSTSPDSFWFDVHAAR